MNTIEYDKNTITKPGKEALSLLFSTLDINKVTFVGGIADYLNLRGHYNMPINDIDIVFRDESVLNELGKVLQIQRFESKYATDTNLVYVTNFKHPQGEIHIDFFKQVSIHKRPNNSSLLLGTKVLHTSFVGMQQFHNEHIELMSSDSKDNQYEWKRLYKHSRKAALYNLITYKQEKQELQPA